jgi:Ca2+-transporting ATPase
MQLRKDIQNETCEVIRGSMGVATTIPVSEIVVGDILVLRAGDRVPADCLLIEEMDMRIDESIYFPDQAEPVEKQVATATNQDTKPDTVLLYRSQITTGYAKAVVLAVGKNTLFEKEDHDDGMTTNLKKETGLEKTMAKVADALSKKSYKLALLIVVILNVYWAFRVMISDMALISAESLQLLLNNFMVGAAFLIAALPEGLPLSVSISTAFSFGRLK